MSIRTRISALEKRLKPPMKCTVILPLDLCETEEDRRIALDWQNGGEERAIRAGHRIYRIPAPEEIDEEECCRL